MQHNVPLMVSNKNRWLCFRALFALPSVSAMTHLLNVSQAKTTETQREKKPLASASFCLQDIKEFRKWNNSKQTLEEYNLSMSGTRRLVFCQLKFCKLLQFLETKKMVFKIKGVGDMIDLQSCGSHGGVTLFSGTFHA